MANLIHIDPQIAREIAESPEFSLLADAGSLTPSAKVEHGESIVDRQRRERLVLEPEVLPELMGNHENYLFGS